MRCKSKRQEPASQPCHWGGRRETPIDLLECHSFCHIDGDGGGRRLPCSLPRVSCSTDHKDTDEWALGRFASGRHSSLPVDSILIHLPEKRRSWRGGVVYLKHSTSLPHPPMKRLIHLAFPARCKDIFASRIQRYVMRVGNWGFIHQITIPFYPSC
jgi:hypothetical protein